MLNLSHKSKGFAHVFLLIVILAGLFVVLYSVGKETNILPKAFEKKDVSRLATSGAPSNLEVGCHSESGQDSSKAVFKWNQVPGVTSYTLNINKVDGGPDDWFPSTDQNSVGDRTLTRKVTMATEPIEKGKNYSWTLIAGGSGNDIDRTANGGEFSCGHPTAYIFGSDYQNREFTTAVNKPLAFNVSSKSITDAGNVNLSKIEVYAAKVSDIDGKTNQPFQGGKCIKTAGSWCLVTSWADIKQNSSQFDGSWVPQQTGDYYVVVNVADSRNQKCSGNPNTPAGWSRCGTKDSIIVHVKDNVVAVPATTESLSAACVDRSTVSLSWPKDSLAKGYRVSLNRLDGPRSTDWSKELNWSPITGTEGTGDRIIKLQADVNKIDALRVNGERSYSWNVAYMSEATDSETKYGNEFSCAHPTAAVFGPNGQTKRMDLFTPAPIIFKAAAQTQFGKLTKVNVYAARKDTAGSLQSFSGNCPGAVAGGVWCKLGSLINPGSGKAELTTDAWTPASGQYFVVANVESDDGGRKCSGNPDETTSAGFDSCGSDGRLTLIVN